MCLNKEDTVRYKFNCPGGLKTTFESILSIANDKELNLTRTSCLVDYNFYLSVRMGTLVESGKYVAFHTGLYDKNNKPICCLGELNNDPRFPQKYTFKRWVVPGEGTIKIERIFNELPKKARLFTDWSELHYDVSLGAPTISIDHAVERADRFPKEFMERICGGPVDGSYADHLKANPMSMQLFRASILAGVQNAFVMAQNDPFLSVPVYYFRTQKISLLLPLFLTSPDHADVALVVSKTDAGDGYVGATVLTLEQAWLDARVLGSVNSNWLKI